MPSVQATNQVNISDNIGLSIKNRCLDFWKWVNREPALAMKKLSDWAWKKISTVEWFYPFYEKHVLNSVLENLRQDYVLTQNEIDLTLKALSDYLSGQKTPINERLFTQLVEKKYITLKDDSKKDFLEQVTKYRTSEKERLEAVIKLSNYLNPCLLVSNKLHRFSEDEIRKIKILSKGSIESSPKEFINCTCEFILDSNLYAQFLAFSNLDRNTLFFVGDKLVSKKTDFEKLSICDLNDLSDYIHLLKDLKSISRKTEEENLDIHTASAIARISFTIDFSETTEDLLDSAEKKVLFRILKKFDRKVYGGPRYFIDQWKFLENNLAKIQELRSKREKNEKLDLSDLSLYVCLIEMFKPGQQLNFIKEHSYWPCKIVKELSFWTPDLSEIDSLKGINLEKMTKALDLYESQFQTDVKKRIKKKDPDYIPDQFDILFLSELLKFLLIFKNVLNSTISSDIQTFLDLYSVDIPEEKQFDNTCPINISFFPYHSPSRIWASKASFLEKIKAIALSILMPYTHTNFSLLVDDKKQKFGLGMNVYEDEIRGVGSLLVQSYPIDPSKLIPRDLNQEQATIFKRVFFINFLDIKREVNKKHYYPEGNKNVIKKFLSGFIPSLFADKAYPFLKSQDSKELFCSEFVFQMIVETYLKTCEILQLEKPDTLSLFGVRSLNGLTPNDLKSLWLKRGVIKKLSA